MDSIRSDIADELSALLEIGTTLLETLEVDRVLQLICSHAQSLLSASGAAISQYEETTDDFFVRFTSGSLEESTGLRFPAEGSLSGVVLESRAPVLENQVPHSLARNAADVVPAEIGRAVVAPLIGRGRVLGTLSCVKAGDEEPFQESDLKLLMAFANQASLAVVNAQGYQDELKRARTLDVLHDRLEEQIRQLHSLHAAGVSVTSDLDLEDLLHLVAEEGRRLTRARYGAVGVVDEEDESLQQFVFVGLTEKERQAMGDLPTGHGLLGAVIQDGHPIRVHTAGEDPRSRGVPAGHPRVTSFLGVPIRIRDRVYGNLYLTNKEGGEPFTENDQTVLEMLASYAAVAIENARLFRERNELIEELESAQRARNRLHAYVNHDIRNALHGVSLWTERLQKRLTAEIAPGGKAEEKAEIASKIRRGSDHALRLVTDILDLARIEEGRFQTWPRKVNLGDLLQAARDSMSPEADLREVELILEEPPESLHAVADPDRVLQVTLNLLSNAVKFSPAGGRVRLGVREERRPPPGWTGEDSPDGGWLVIWVDDQGPGIRNEDLKRIFADFEQLDTATGNRGTGLGLSLCRNLAHHMGGSIQVQSEVGEGSTFSLWLPGGGTYQGREGWIG